MRAFTLVIAATLLSALLSQSKASDDLKDDFKKIENLMAAALDKRAPKWRCQIERQYVCDVQGCIQQKPSIWLTLDFPKLEYKRCDTKGCDTYPLSVANSGIFTHVGYGWGGTIFKAVNDGSAFVEVATSGTSTYNGFGSCMRQ